MFRMRPGGAAQRDGARDAPHVDVSVILENGAPAYTIADDGRGFDAEVAQAARDDGHFGLRVLADLARDAAASSTSTPQPGRGTRVLLGCRSHDPRLLAEDHEVVRAGLAQLLERADDIEVVGAAADGAEAVTLAADHGPDVGPHGPVDAGPGRHRGDEAHLGPTPTRASWC